MVGARFLPKFIVGIEPGISRTEVRVLTTELRRLRCMVRSEFYD